MASPISALLSQGCLFAILVGLTSKDSSWRSNAVKPLSRSQRATLRNSERGKKEENQADQALHS